VAENESNNFLVYLSTAPILAFATTIVLSVVLIAINIAFPDLLSL